MVSNNDYQAEKMMQYRLSEIDRNTRDGLYIKPIKKQQGAGIEQTSKHRGFWDKWFGSRRLGTSYK